MTAGTIADRQVGLGDTVTVDVSRYFSDPDGNRLSYGARSSDASVVAAAAAESAVTLAALARGAATITVTATDPDGLAASLSFTVTVPNSAPEAGAEFPDLELELGLEASVEFSERFSDPDGDALSYSAASSDPSVATVSGPAPGETAVTVRAEARGTATITVTATDPDGLAASLSFEVTVPNSAPEAASEFPDLELGLGLEAAVDASERFSDPDGDALSYAAASSDSSVATVSDPAPGETAVTVRAEARGAATITVTATDPDGLAASLSFEVTVPNSAPEAASEFPDLELGLGLEASVDASERFADPDGDALSYSATSSDSSVASVSGPAPGEASATVRAETRGTATITVTATDPDGLAASLSFTVTVPNSAPEAGAEFPDLELELGLEASVEFSERFSDPDGDALSYSAASSDPSVATVSGPAPGETAVTVRAEARGTATITVTATDPDGLAASLSFEVTVPNSAPEAASEFPDLELGLGLEASVDASERFADPDGDALSYSATSSDSSVASVSGPAPGEASATVRAEARGTATITVTATDPDGLAASLSFTVTVPNSAPEAASGLPDLVLGVGEAATVQLSDYFTDPDGDALSYEASSSDPETAAADVSGETLEVRLLVRGSAVVTVTATDPDGLAASLSLQVFAPNRPPVTAGAISDLSLRPGEESRVDATPWFTDPDGDPLTYESASSDAGVAEASVSGTIIVVRAVAIGSAAVAVTALDPFGASARQSFTVTVADAPPPPPNQSPRATSTIPNLNVSVGDTVTFAPSAYFEDPDGDALSFALSTSNASVAGVALAGERAQVSTAGAGEAVVTVTARDTHGAAASQSVRVTVWPSTSSFDLVIAFVGTFTSAQRAVIAGAAQTWSEILTDSELSDITLGRSLSCGGLAPDGWVGTVDDLLVLVGAETIDGDGGVLAYAGPCLVRRSDELPVMGRVVFDAADLDLGDALLRDVALHEFAHVFGLGTLWDYGSDDLLANPVSRAPEGETPDTHFTGALAVAAFDAAGGADYTDGKVPVQNVSPGADGHWRASVFTGELMGPALSGDGGASLSAITIQSLADLGWSVDASRADAYTITAGDAAPGRLRTEGDLIELGDDFRRLPLRVVDDGETATDQGGVIRLVPRNPGGPRS